MSDETTLFLEYPKMITTPDGVQVTVTSAEDEARWMHPPTPEAPAHAQSEPDVAEAEPSDADAVAEPSSPLDDVTVEMDNPTFDPPKKKAAKKK